MKGILLASHGQMAKGILNTLGLFFDEELTQIDAMELRSSDSPDDFGIRMEEKIRELDTGEGVYILTDLYGGTPNNQALMRASDTVTVLSGVNLALVMELVTERFDGEVDLEEVLNTGHEGMVNASAKLFASVSDEDDD